jgi:hypothetical protein
VRRRLRPGTAFNEVWVYAGLIGLFAISRVLYYRAGVRFEANTIYYFAQLLDPVLLRTRLLESLWYLHSQPPVFNGLTGLALKLAPDAFAPLLMVAFLATSCVVMLLLYATLRRLGAEIGWASFATLVFCCSPAFVLYENWYFYPHLVLAVLVGIAYALLRSGGKPSPWLALAFWLCAVLVGLRSVYHPLYAVLAVVAVALVAGRANWLHVGKLAALPLLLIGALLVKNWILFDLPATSSWGGNSLHRVATAGIEHATLQRLVDQGVIAPIALESQFAPGNRIAELLELEPQQTRIPALDQTHKTPLNEYTLINAANYNNWAYAAASTSYTRDALVLIRRYPRAYLAVVAYNARRFLDPVTRDGFLRDNRQRIMPAVRIWDRIDRYAHVPAGLAFMFALAALLRRDMPGGERLLLVYLVGTVAWATVIGTTFETGENNRFRYHLTGLHLLLIASLLMSMAGWLKQAAYRRRAVPATGDSPDRPATDVSR